MQPMDLHAQYEGRAESISSRVTKRMIAEMLLENTGSSFLDSGGAYGRAWQHTRAKYGLDGGLPNSPWDGGPGHSAVDPTCSEIDRVVNAMDAEPAGYIDDWGGVTVDTYHWLVDRLDFDPQLHEKYERWQRLTNFGKDRWSKDWGLPLMDRFVEQLAKHGTVTGIYGDGGPISDNTYNHEDALGRTLQYTWFRFEQNERGFLPDGAYVLLQIHGGADVRGGYTDPKLFTTGNGDDADFFDNNSMYVACGGADIVPDGQIEGQINGFTAEILHAEHVTHYWDNSYGDSWLRGPDYQIDGKFMDGIGLALAQNADEAEKLRTEPREKYYHGPKEFVISTRDDDGVWRCPYDNSPLHAGGNQVG